MIFRYSRIYNDDLGKSRSIDRMCINTLVHIFYVTNHLTHRWKQRQSRLPDNSSRELTRQSWDNLRTSCVFWFRGCRVRIHQMYSNKRTRNHDSLCEYWCCHYRYDRNEKSMDMSRSEWYRWWIIECYGWYWYRYHTNWCILSGWKLYPSRFYYEWDHYWCKRNADGKKCI